MFQVEVLDTVELQRLEGQNHGCVVRLSMNPNPFKTLLSSLRESTFDDCAETLSRWLSQFFSILRKVFCNRDDRKDGEFAELKEPA